MNVYNKCAHALSSYLSMLCTSYPTLSHRDYIPGDAGERLDRVLVRAMLESLTQFTDGMQLWIE